ncbi:uncharacterized protein LOC114522787 [Dendronephthya gigantea]|uniref:uncharacterized protein LOC114522787 n=1 Tax=Dendronephthya gigantea TaxID=151771 RepID=UPI00106B4A24|nr:uncharacterized protein LOC114522787 [Dendronephthya gigantea]
MDKVSEYKNTTPSLAESSVSHIVSLLADEQCYNGQVLMDVDSKDLVCTSGYNEAQSEEVQDDVKAGATCVTLQVIDNAKKTYRGQQKSANAKTIFRSSERRGAVFSSIPTKETVNPNKGLQEAIEERLKACLKNSAASLRERPHTASNKLARKPIQSDIDSDMLRSDQLPPRPKTVPSSHVGRGHTLAKKDNQSQVATRDTLFATLRSLRTAR